MQRSRTATASSPFQNIALVLQGGGALGAYQAGVYEALAGAGYAPDWFAGISIGAINASILAGNAPERRLEKLRVFWEQVTSACPWPVPIAGEIGHQLFNRTSAGIAALYGLPGFFLHRFPPALFAPRGSDAARSIYDTSPLAETITRLVDFNRINSGDTRLSLGAVDVRTGDSVYFDSTQRTIGVEHVMASGALPPGFPPICIDGEYFWDGGLLSNTPLHYLFETGFAKDTLIFQVDLFSAEGQLPRDLLEVEERRKDIAYSSRTRLNTETFQKKHELRRAIAKLCDLLPRDVQQQPEVQHLRSLGRDHAVLIAHMIYRRKNYDTESKDYEFSRSSMLEHWQAGRTDAQRMLRSSAWLQPQADDLGVRVFDLAQ
jgi:NTE family protein